MLYMCAVLDLCGKVVLAWKIGADMTSSLVTDTIREALQTEKVTGGLALHSDQGVSIHIASILQANTILRHNAVHVKERKSL